jgi:hypothetical protein
MDEAVPAPRTPPSLPGWSILPAITSFFRTRTNRAVTSRAPTSPLYTPANAYNVYYVKLLDYPCANNGLAKTV